jgi:hypothetical protein
LSSWQVPPSFTGADICEAPEFMDAVKSASASLRRKGSLSLVLEKVLEAIE